MLHGQLGEFPVHIRVLLRVTVNNVKCLLLLFVYTILILPRNRSHQVLTVVRK